MLIVGKEAEQDIQSAFKWYEHQREGLGRDFVREIDRALEAVQEQPEAYSQC